MASCWTLYGIALIVSAVAIGANARAGPCKTLYISSLTFSSSIDLENPNEIGNYPPRTLFTIWDLYAKQEPIEILVERGPSLDSGFIYGRSRSRSRSVPNHLNHQQHKADVSSLRERTKDILSVVAALLFGVGCGALTSATMYLAWSLITSNRYEAPDADYVDFTTDDDDDVDVSPKKMGYKKIPDDAVAPAPAPAPAPANKEVV